MEIVLAVAVAGRSTQARDIDWIRRRFGLGQSRPESLLSIARQQGVSKEWVRQLEARVLNRARSAVIGRTLPMLSAIRERVGLSPDESSGVLEEEIKPMLGAVGLAAALRFVSIVDPTG
jgi:hypothetical protein